MKNPLFTLTRRELGLPKGSIVHLFMFILWIGGVSLGIAEEPHPIPIVPEDILFRRDIKYREGKSEAWKLNLAAPKQRGEKPFPAIVLLHGGGWIQGDKNSLDHECIRYAKLGFCALTVNYRFSNEAPFPAAVEDAKCAVRWLRAHAREYNVDVNRIGAWGQSAGGHLALMLAMAGKEAGLEGDGPHQDQSSMAQAAVSDSGPVNLDVRRPEIAVIGYVINPFLAGPPETLGERIKKASPISYLSPATPPLLLIFSGADEQVAVETSDEFVAAAWKMGLKNIDYIRLGPVTHCPQSMVGIRYLNAAVEAFFMGTLMNQDRSW